MATANPKRDEALTTPALLGYLLAGMPGTTLGAREAAERINRHRSGVNQAVTAMTKARLIRSEPDPEDRRRNVVSMTPEQAEAWIKDPAERLAAAGLNLQVSDGAKGATVSTAGKPIRREPTALRFGVYNDGALIIEGLARKQLTIPAGDAAALAQALAALPEGALQALFSSPLRPTFSLHVDGRDYPLDAQQTADLVDYIEQLPAKALRAANDGRFPGVQKHGTDHRVNRIGTPADED